MQKYLAPPYKCHMSSNSQPQMLGNLQELLWALLKYLLSKQDNHEESKKTSNSDIPPKIKRSHLCMIPLSHIKAVNALI